MEPNRPGATNACRVVRPTPAARAPRRRLHAGQPHGTLVRAAYRVAWRHDLVERFAGPVPLGDGLPQALALGLHVVQQRLLVDASGPAALHEHLAIDDDGLDVASAATVDERLDRIVHGAVVQVA